MAQTEDNGGLILGEGSAVAAKGFAVGYSVAIEQGGAVLQIHHREMDGLVHGGLGRGPREIERAREAVASGDPVAVLAFAEHNGVEEIAGPLRAHHASAALVEVGNGEPYFQSLGLEVNGQLGALEKTAVEHDLATLEGDVAAGLEREIADGALEVAVKFPGRVGFEVDRLLVGGVLFAFCQ